jgi:hypothetical protein
MKRTYDVMLASIEYGGWVHRATLKVGSGRDERWVGERTESIIHDKPDVRIKRRLLRRCVEQLRKEF